MMALRLTLLCKNVLAEVEFFVQDSTTPMSLLHIFIDFGNWNVKVESKAQNSSRQKDNEDGKCCVLEISDLNLHASEFDSPANVRVWRRRLKTHGLPISRLNILCSDGIEIYCQHNF